MTFQTREQHIRRGKATSNICTNEGLCSLTAVAFLSWLGSNGLQELSRINFDRGQKLANTIGSIRGFEKRFTGVHFNEFVIKCHDANKVSKELLKRGIQGGLILNKWHHPELKNCMLFGVSEMHADKDIEKLSSALKEV
jgi:glycine dehydrogenase subunit 1